MRSTSVLITRTITAGGAQSSGALRACMICRVCPAELARNVSSGNSRNLSGARQERLPVPPRCRKKLWTKLLPDCLVESRLPPATS